jgi:hypothetical protein
VTAFFVARRLVSCGYHAAAQRIGSGRKGNCKKKKIKI